MADKIDLQNLENILGDPELEADLIRTISGRFSETIAQVNEAVGREVAQSLGKTPQEFMKSVNKQIQQIDKTVAQYLKSLREKDLPGVSEAREAIISRFKALTNQFAELQPSLKKQLRDMEKALGDIEVAGSVSQINKILEKKTRELQEETKRAAGSQQAVQRAADRQAAQMAKRAEETFSPGPISADTESREFYNRDKEGVLRSIPRFGEDEVYRIARRELAHQLDAGKVLEEPIKRIQDETIRSAVQQGVQFLPRYFLDVGSSSSRKYHPEFSHGMGGLERHTRYASDIMEALFASPMGEKLAPMDKDIARASILFHDALKRGGYEAATTVEGHEFLVRDWYEQNIKPIIKDNEAMTKAWEEILKDIEGHHSFSREGTLREKIVHLSDALSAIPLHDILKDETSPEGIYTREVQMRHPEDVKADIKEKIKQKGLDKLLPLGTVDQFVDSLYESMIERVQPYTNERELKEKAARAIKEQMLKGERSINFAGIDQALLSQLLPDDEEARKVKRASIAEYAEILSKQATDPKSLKVLSEVGNEEVKKLSGAIHENIKSIAQALHAGGEGVYSLLDELKTNVGQINKLEASLGSDPKFRTGLMAVNTWFAGIEGKIRSLGTGFQKIEKQAAETISRGFKTTGMQNLELRAATASMLGDPQVLSLLVKSQESTAKQAVESATRDIKEVAKLQVEEAKLYNEAVKSWKETLGKTKIRLPWENKGGGIGGGGFLNGFGAFDNERGMRRLRNLYHQAGYLVGFTGTYTTVNIINKMTQAITDHEQAVVKLKRVYEGLGNELDLNFQRIVDDLTELTVKYGLTIKQVAKIQEEWFKTGYENAEDLRKLTEAGALMLNVSDFTDAESAVKMLNSAMKQMGFSADMAIPLLDSWNKVADQFPADMRDFAEAYSRSSAFAKQLGLDMHELNAAIAILQEKTGRSGREIGTALQSIFSFATRPIAIETLRQFGVEMMENQYKFRDFTDIMDELHQKFKEFDAADANVFITKIANALGMTRRKNFVIALIEGWDKFNEVVKTSLTSSGYSMEKNRETMESLAKQVQVLWANFQKLSVEAGKAGLLPILHGIVGGLNSLSDALYKADPVTRSFAVDLAGLATSFMALNYAAKFFSGQSIIQWLQILFTPATRSRSFTKGVGDALESFRTGALSAAETIAQMEELRKRFRLSQETFISALSSEALEKAKLNPEQINALTKAHQSLEKAQRATIAAESAWQASLRETTKITRIVSAVSIASLVVTLGALAYQWAKQKREMESYRKRLEEVSSSAEKIREAERLLARQREIESKGLETSSSDRRELEQIQYRLAELFHMASNLWDENGKALANNYELTREILELERERLDLQRQALALEAGEKLPELKNKKEDVEKRIQSLESERATLISARMSGSRFIVNEEGDLVDVEKELERVVKALTKAKEEQIELRTAIAFREDQQKYLDNIYNIRTETEKNTFAAQALADVMAPLNQQLVSSASSAEEYGQSLEATGEAGESLGQTLESINVGWKDPLIGVDTQTLSEIYATIEKASGLSSKTKRYKELLGQVNNLLGEFGDLQVSSMEEAIQVADSLKDSLMDRIVTEKLVTQQVKENLLERLELMRQELELLQALSSQRVRTNSLALLNFATQTSGVISNVEASISYGEAQSKALGDKLEALENTVNQVKGLGTQYWPGGGGGRSEQEPFDMLDWRMRQYYKVIEELRQFDDFLSSKGSYLKSMSELGSEADQLEYTRRYLKVLNEQVEVNTKLADEYTKVTSNLKKEMSSVEAEIKKICPTEEAFGKLSEENKEKVWDLTQKLDDLKSKLEEANQGFYDASRAAGESRKEMQDLIMHYIEEGAKLAKQIEIDKLNKKFEEFRDKQEERIKELEKESDAIQKAADERVKAIEKEIEAIQEEADQEDELYEREERLARLRELLANRERILADKSVRVLTERGWEYTYNQQALEEVDRNIAKEREELRRWEIEKQREHQIKKLEDQIKAIEEESRIQQEALEEEIKRLQEELDKKEKAHQTELDNLEKFWDNYLKLQDQNMKVNNEILDGRFLEALDKAKAYYDDMRAIAEAMAALDMEPGGSGAGPYPHLTYEEHVGTKGNMSNLSGALSLIGLVNGLVPFLDKGGRVLETGLAVVHKGEEVIPKTIVDSLVKLSSKPVPTVDVEAQPVSQNNSRNFYGPINLNYVQDVNSFLRNLEQFTK